MKKSILWMMAAILCCGSLVLSSCSDSENNSNNNGINNDSGQPEASGLWQPENEFWTKVATATVYDQSVVDALYSISGVSDVKPFEMVHHWDEVNQRYVNKTAYFFYFAQLIDHNDPGKGTYKQQCILTVAGKNRPTVLHTEGYALEENANRLDSIPEPALVDVLEANCLQVEHRYFGWSLPEDWTNQWNYLSIRQQCADLHDVVTAIKQSGIVGSGKWLSSGVSKNGVTTAFYGYSYPDDMDAYVSYCAPFMTSLVDPGVAAYEFSTACMGANLEKYKESFQAWCDNRELQSEAVKLYKEQYDPKAVEKFGTDEEIRLNLLTQLFINMFKKLSYVHYTKWEHMVPKTGDSAEKFLDFILANERTTYPTDTELEAMRRIENANDIGDIFNTVDDYLEKLGITRAEQAYRLNPFDIQTELELGTIQENISWVEGMLTDVEKGRILRSDKPYNPGITYDGGALMKKFLSEIKQKQSRICFVYGTQDPWTGCAIPDENLGPNMKKISINEGLHSDAIHTWNSSERNELFHWLQSIGFDLQNF